jgi:hypothetical protein
MPVKSTTIAPMTPAIPACPDSGSSAIPAAADNERGQHDWQTPATARAQLIGHAACHRHQQQEQYIVERHHETDHGRMAAEHALDERRQERGDERPGNAGEEAAQTDECTCGVRHALNTRAVDGKGIVGSGHRQKGSRWRREDVGSAVRRAFSRVNDPRLAG